jgi:hypothetical protein
MRPRTTTPTVVATAEIVEFITSCQKTPPLRTST